MPELPASWISLVFLLAALVSYSINSITWLIGSWSKSTTWEKLRADLTMFFPGRYRNPQQLRWFRFRLIFGNACLGIAILAFFLSYVIAEISRA